MGYKNFLLRSLFSIIFLSIYFISLLIDFKAIFYLIIIIYLLTILEIYFYFKKNKFIPIIYVIISFIFFILIEFKQSIFLNFNLFIFIVISFDIFSYASGKIIGRNKLINISPNKTIEGLFGGFIISFISSLLLSYFLDININIKLISFILIIILMSFIGDLIESYFKRINSLKNSSEFIPGHGGVFDRFDSFLFAIIFFSIFINFIK